MKKPHLVNIITALVVILAGVYAYLSNDKRPVSALIAPGIFGFLLLIMTPGVKSGNKIIAHVVVVLTLVFGLFTGFQAIKSMDFPDKETGERRVKVFSIMSLACLTATGFYVAGFIDKRKERKKLEGSN